MRKQLLSLCMALGLLPATALAAESAPSTLIVGNITVDLTDGGYWTADTSGNLTSCKALTTGMSVMTPPRILYLIGSTIEGEYSADNPPIADRLGLDPGRLTSRISGFPLPAADCPEDESC